MTQTHTDTSDRIYTDPVDELREQVIRNMSAQDEFNRSVVRLASEDFAQLRREIRDLRSVVYGFLGGFILAVLMSLIVGLVR